MICGGNEVSASPTQFFRPPHLSKLGRTSINQPKKMFPPQTWLLAFSSMQPASYGLMNESGIENIFKKDRLVYSKYIEWQIFSLLQASCIHVFSALVYSHGNNND